MLIRTRGLAGAPAEFAPAKNDEGRKSRFALQQTGPARASSLKPTEFKRPTYSGKRSDAFSLHRIEDGRISAIFRT
jgi:hypothetical protein